MDYEKTAVILKAIADPKRLKIINLLAVKSMCACEILEHFDFTQPTLSHHLKILENTGIITVKKRSQWHYYAINEMIVKDIVSTMGLICDMRNCN